MNTMGLDFGAIRQKLNNSVSFDESLITCGLTVVSSGFMLINGTVSLGIVLSFSKDLNYNKAPLMLQAIAVDANNAMLDYATAQIVKSVPLTSIKFTPEIVTEIEKTLISVVGDTPTANSSNDNTISTELCDVPFEIDYNSFTERNFTLFSYGFQPEKSGKNIEASVFFELNVGDVSGYKENATVCCTAILYNPVGAIVATGNVDVFGWGNKLESRVQSFTLKYSATETIAKVKLSLEQDKPATLLHLATDKKTVAQASTPSDNGVAVTIDSHSFDSRYFRVVS